MSDSVLREKSKAFAKEIITLCKSINSSKIESVLANQLIRSGTSIGANIYEAQYAQSKLDFISKFEIALKNVMKASIGWNFYLKQATYLKMILKNLIIIVAQ